MSTWEVITGDALVVLRTIPAGSVDACITDPPYGIGDVWKGGASCGWGKAQEQTEHRNSWDVLPDPEVFSRICGLDVPAIVWGGNHFYNLPPSRGWLVWNKPERNFSLAEAELAWTNIDTVIRVFDYRRSDPDRVHPTQKPVALMRWCIDRLRLPPGSTIIDPFCGVGTTGVACMQAGMNFLGVEIDETYASIARRRISEAATHLFVPPAPKVAEPELFGAGG